jgi:hypothetical protein
MLYFEGNDLLNVAQYIERENSGLDWREYDLQGVAWYRRLVTVPSGTLALQPAPEPSEVRYRYPLTVNTEAGLVRLFSRILICCRSAPIMRRWPILMSLSELRRRDFGTA